MHLQIIAFIAGITLGALASSIYHWPEIGDLQIRDGVEREYRCNWAGCLWGLTPKGLETVKEELRNEIRLRDKK